MHRGSGNWGLVVLALIYGLIDPRDGTIRYIGKTQQSLQCRLRGHLNCAGRRHVTCWIRQLKDLGLTPQIQLMAQVDNSRWQELEREFIARGKSLGYRLTNMTEGGEGGYQGSPSQERYEKVARALRGRKTRPEVVERLRFLHLGKKESERTIAIKREATRRQWAEGRGRQARLLTVGNRVQSIRKWANECGLPVGTLYGRLRSGLDPESIVNPRRYATGRIRTNQQKAWETRRRKYGENGRAVIGRYSAGQKARYSRNMPHTQ
jgi:hypothetical protein